MSLAIQNLEMLRRVAKLHKRNNAEWYFGELTDYSVVLRDAEIERRANRIWAIHDGPALQAEFDKRLSPKGFNIGFSFDISDPSALPAVAGQVVDENADDEQWAAAWQLAIESLGSNPPELPEFDLEDHQVVA